VAQESILVRDRELPVAAVRSFEVVAYDDQHHDAIVRMVAGRIAALRAVVTAIPDRMIRHDALCDPLADELAPLLRPDRCRVAVRGTTVVGFLSWHETPNLRGTGCPGAWSPAHGAAVHRAEHAPAEVHEALYEAAARAWAASGRAVLSGSVLRGHDREHQTWVINGFGRFLHDAVIPLPPARTIRHTDMTIRRATLDDVPVLADLEREHSAHYTDPPVFMVPPEPADADELVAFLGAEPNSIWVAADDVGPQAYLRFEARSDGATPILHSPTTISITGAFTRPELRGRYVADALLLTAMTHYAALGFERVAIDHETTNPPARRFWGPRSQLVAVSYLRVLERPPGVNA